MDSDIRFGRVLSVIVVLAMVVSGLTALCAPAVSADQTIRQDDLELVFNDNYMLDGCPAPYTERVYDCQSNNPGGHNLYRVGEGDGVLDWTASDSRLRLTIRVLDTDVTDLFINITGIQTAGMFDFDDGEDAGTGTSEDAYPVQSEDNYWAAGALTTHDFDFYFDILSTNVIGYSDATRVTCGYSFRDVGDGTKKSGDFPIYIYIASIFDQGANDHDAGVFPNLVEFDEFATGDDGYFEAGDHFVDTRLTLNCYGADAIDDLWCNLTPPTGISLGGDGTCWLPDGIAGDSSETLYYRSNIDLGLAPGLYRGTAALQYTRMDSGLRITEPTRPITWPVDFSFRDADPTPSDKMYSFDQMQVTDAALIDDGSGSRMIDGHCTPVTANDEPDTTEEGIPYGAQEDEVNPLNNAWFIPSVAIAMAGIIAALALMYKRKQ